MRCKAYGNCNKVSNSLLILVLSLIQIYPLVPSIVMISLTLVLVVVVVIMIGYYLSTSPGDQDSSSGVLDDVPVPAIAGAIVGGFAVLVILAVTIIILFRKRRGGGGNGGKKKKVSLIQPQFGEFSFGLNNKLQYTTSDHIDELEEVIQSIPYLRYLYLSVSIRIPIYIYIHIHN